jgi:hypothetical protein
VWNLRVLDAGCGRGDLLDFFIVHRHPPLSYTGIEAVPELANVADMKRLHGEPPNIIRGDFVTNRSLLHANADVIIFCGSLNTMDKPTFYAMLEDAFKSAAKAVVFNFLSSRELANSPHLTWHEPHRVLSFCRQLSEKSRLWEDYMSGDATGVIPR